MSPAEYIQAARQIGSRGLKIRTLELGVTEHPNSAPLLMEAAVERIKAANKWPARARRNLLRAGAHLTSASRAIDKSDAQSHFRLGRIQRRAGFFEDSEISFTRSLEIDPLQGGAVLELARLYQLWGQPDRIPSLLIGYQRAADRRQIPLEECDSRVINLWTEFLRLQGNIELDPKSADPIRGRREVVLRAGILAT